MKDVERGRNTKTLIIFRWVFNGWSYTRNKLAWWPFKYQCDGDACGVRLPDQATNFLVSKATRVTPGLWKLLAMSLGVPPLLRNVKKQRADTRGTRTTSAKKKKKRQVEFFLLPSYQDIWHHVDGSGHELGLSGGGIRITFTRNDLDSLDWPHWVSSFQFKDWIMQQKCPYLIAQPIRR